MRVLRTRLRKVASIRIEDIKEYFIDLLSNVSEYDDSDDENATRTHSFVVDCGEQSFKVDLAIGLNNVMPYEQHFVAHPDRHLLSASLNAYGQDFMEKWSCPAANQLCRLAKLFNKLYLKKGGKGPSSFLVQQVMVYVIHEHFRFDMDEVRAMKLSDGLITQLITAFLRKLVAVFTCQQQLRWDHVSDFYAKGWVSPSCILAPKGEPVIVKATDPTDNLVVSDRLNNKSISHIVDVACKLLKQDAPKWELPKPTPISAVLDLQMRFSSEVRRCYLAASLESSAAQTRPMPRLQEESLKALRHDNEWLPVQLDTARLCFAQLSVESIFDNERVVASDEPVVHTIPYPPVACGLDQPSPMQTGLRELRLHDNRTWTDISVRSRIAFELAGVGEYDTAMHELAACIRQDVPHCVFWDVHRASFTAAALLAYCDVHRAQQQSAQVVLAWSVYKRVDPAKNISMSSAFKQEPQFEHTIFRKQMVDYYRAVMTADSERLVSSIIETLQPLVSDIEAAQLLVDILTDSSQQTDRKKHVGSCRALVTQVLQWFAVRGTSVEHVFVVVQRRYPRWFECAMQFLCLPTVAECQGFTNPFAQLLGLNSLLLLSGMGSTFRYIKGRDQEQLVSRCLATFDDCERIYIALAQCDNIPYYWFLRFLFHLRKHLLEKLSFEAVDRDLCKAVATGDENLVRRTCLLCCRACSFLLQEGESEQTRTAAGSAIVSASMFEKIFGFKFMQDSTMERLLPEFHLIWFSVSDSRRLLAAVREIGLQQQLRQSQQQQEQASIRKSKKPKKAKKSKKR
eukprot:TRINITY_DN442_c0_g1_i10.p1 TRINITY_DN442_c0_g1~~TRINITY_DN442_c0_g1_i10.p1  ORF type:complete len:795 (+),score=126.47 TRINITY_DN442_c0_g1_i10:1807-4191(+)